MVALDTNVLLRLFLDDSPEQKAAAQHLIATKSSPENPAFVGQVVLCEAIWVLRFRYGYRREELARLLEGLLYASNIEVENADIARAALEDYEQGKADFSDYVILRQAAAHDATPLYTFDETLAKHSLAKLMKRKK